MRGIRSGVAVATPNKGGVSWVEFPGLGPGSDLVQACSTRLGGVSEGPLAGLNLHYRVGDRPMRVRENRDLLCRALGVDPRRLTTVNQVHGGKVVRVAAGDAGRGAQDDPLEDADALLTNVPRVPILIQTADCLPILFYDPVKKVVGLAHAGWKGTVLGIGAKTLRAMEGDYGSNPGDVRAAFGPCIGACCFEVGEEARGPFVKAFEWADEVFRRGFGERWHLDLEAANARQLLDAGIPEKNLIRPGICTTDNLDMFYSHRVEAAGGGKTGRFGSILMLKG